MQIKLLKILAALGAGDKQASDNIYEVVASTMKRANPTHTIGNAITYECIRTITTIIPSPPLLQQGMASLLRGGESCSITYHESRQGLGGNVFQ